MERSHGQEFLATFCFLEALEADGASAGGVMGNQGNL